MAAGQVEQLQGQEGTASRYAVQCTQGAEGIDIAAFVQVQSHEQSRIERREVAEGVADVQVGQLQVGVQVWALFQLRAQPAGCSLAAARAGRVLVPPRQATIWTDAHLKQVKDAVAEAHHQHAGGLVQVCTGDPCPSLVEEMLDLQLPPSMSKCLGLGCHLCQCCSAISWDSSLHWLCCASLGWGGGRCPWICTCGRCGAVSLRLLPVGGRLPCTCSRH